MSNNKKRRLKNKLIAIFLGIFSFSSVVILFILFSTILVTGIGALDFDFLINFTSRKPEDAGILPGLVGSLMVVFGALLFALPIGISTAIYLQEFGKKNKLVSLIQTLIYNLAGVPSIVYGIFGATFFVATLRLIFIATGSSITTGRVLLSGILTMGILVLPIIIVTAQEALKTVPKSMKEASYALGATEVQTTFKVTFRFAFPNILTGVILAIARILGETAPLLMVGASGFITFLPTDFFKGFTILPALIYTWTFRPIPGFKEIAAAAIIVLVLLQLIISSVAIITRALLQKRYE